MAQKVKLSIFESLELQWSWDVSVVQTFEVLDFGKNSFHSKYIYILSVHPAQLLNVSQI